MEKSKFDIKYNHPKLLSNIQYRVPFFTVRAFYLLHNIFLIHALVILLVQNDDKGEQITVYFITRPHFEAINNQYFSKIFIILAKIGWGGQTGYGIFHNFWLQMLSLCGSVRIMLNKHPLSTPQGAES